MAKKSALIGLIVVMISLAFPVKYALACSCAPPGPDAQAVGVFDAVFSGTVVGKEDPEGDGPGVSSGRPIIYSFEVDAIVKGDVAADQEVTSAADGASCGYSFRNGRRYVLFADEDKKGDLNVSLCSNTHELKEGENIEFAATHAPAGTSDEGDEGDEGEPDEGIPMVAWMGAGMIVVLGATALVLSRRRKSDG